MNTKDVLTAARKKIGRPERWTKNAPARDGEGNLESVDSTRAVCWCAIGAISAASFRHDFEVEVGAVNALADALPAMPRGRKLAIAEFNDDPNTTHADVLALFDRAIAACKEE